jgi:hypothetical protein
MQRLVESPLAAMIIAGEVEPGQMIHIGYAKEEIQPEAPAEGEAPPEEMEIHESLTFGVVVPESETPVSA